MNDLKLILIFFFLILEQVIYNFLKFTFFCPLRLFHSLSHIGFAVLVLWESHFTPGLTRDVCISLFLLKHKSYVEWTKIVTTHPQREAVRWVLNKHRTFPEWGLVPEPHCIALTTGVINNHPDTWRSIRHEMLP